jgi:cytosine/adenosine deaminase-related metal-dependent hydrolase
MDNDCIVLAGGFVHTMVEGEAPGNASIIIKDGVISEIIPCHGGEEREFPRGAAVYDVRGMIVAPGFIDIHIHDE